MSENCDWLTVDDSNGSNNGSFTVNYSENIGSQRSCTIDISGDNGNNTTHTLTQEDGFVSIQADNKLSNSLNVYPNPTSDLINIVFDDKSLNITKVNLYNSQGQLFAVLGEGELGSHNLQLDMSIYPNGIYFLNIQTAQGSIVRKILVMK